MVSYAVDAQDYTISLTHRHATFAPSCACSTTTSRCPPSHPWLLVDLQGADGIIPVYHMGNTQLLDAFPQSAERLSRTLKSALCVFYGVAGLPLPRRREVRVCVLGG